MFRDRVARAAIIAFLCAASSATAWPQAELKPTHEIHLPLPSSRGTFQHFPNVDMSARDHFALRVAPNQSLLVLDSDASGRWSLVRVTKWWTNTPASEVLTVPGWTQADAKYLATLHVDLQITPDGRNAVALAGADWMSISDFLVFAPRGYVQRKPDTLITLIDLAQWKIIKTIHTTSITDEPLRGVRIINNQWLALDFSLGKSPLRQLLDRYDTLLLSLPDLHPGAQCISDRNFRGPSSLRGDSQALKQHNDVACHDVLQAAQTASVETLEIYIVQDRHAQPPAVQQASPALLRTEWEFFRGWGEYPYFEFLAENPPFESSSHHWYGLYNAHDRGLDNLVIFDAVGDKDSTHRIDHLHCGDPEFDTRGSACGCRVVDVSEQTHALLSHCRTQHGDYDGTVRREWLSVLHSDDFSPAGFIILSGKDVRTLHAIAIGDNHPYVVTLESGDPLKIYPIPEGPRSNIR